MCKLRRSLLDQYEQAFKTTSVVTQAIVQAAFSHKLLLPDKKLSNTGQCPDQLAVPGLVRYERATNDR